MYVVGLGHESGEELLSNVNAPGMSFDYYKKREENILQIGKDVHALSSP